MERIRDGRRGNLAAVNGLSRRRPRSGSLRDSPEEDGGAEMQETSRFRDRGGRKDRDRDRSTRSKRRRGDRLLHGGNREEGEDSTDESVDEEEEDDGEDSVPAVRLPPPTFSHPSPPPVTLPSNPNPRKIFPSNVMRPPAVWKAADEMIGVSVPRKARSAHAKRPHECLPSSSGGAGGGSGEQMHRQPSTSPSRSSQTSAAAAPPPTPISPASSSAPIRRKTKQITGGKQRPPKISKSSSSIQEIEIEVAEVLYGLTRQFQDPSKSEAQTLDPKEANGSCHETKSRASSPSCFSPPRAASQSQSSALPHVPKRKRPRAVKYEDESPAGHSNRPPAAANASISSSSKASEAVERPKMDIPSLKLEKTASSPAENGSVALDSRSHPPEESKPEEIAAAELETSVHSKEPARGFDGNDVAATTIKPVPEDDRDHSREKFQIDLMAPPPGKISPEMESDFVVEDSKPSVQDVDRMTKAEFLKTEEPTHERAPKPETRREESSEKSEKISPHPDAPLDGERGDKVRIGGGKQPVQRPQLSKATKPESRPDRAGQSGPVPLPMSVAGWPGGLPFGYVGQVPSLPAMVPVDGSAAAAKALQQLRPRRCATHCYIAQNIYYQQLTRMNPFWPAKPYNLNMMPAADHAFPARLQDSKAVPVAPLVGAIPVSKEKSGGLADTAQRKQQQQQQLLLQQPLQPGAANNNILPAPAFIFPINQPQGAAASAPANRAAAAPSDASAAPASAGAFNYGNLTQGEAQYLVLQNHGYPFPIPAHVGTPPYRGAAQALPFFNGSLYASQILHPSQLHQQQPPQGHQNASNSTGSSSSQKHSQKADPVEAPPPQKHSQQRPPSHLLPHQARQMEGENGGGGGGDSPSSVDSRISHKGGGLYGHNFVMPLHPQNFALMALGGDKSQQQQQQQLASSQQQGMKVELAPSQAFAMSFASFNGAVAAAAAGQAHALDFSTNAQNHAIFQSLPEAARHAYQAQHKKSQHQPLPDKFLAESMSSAGEDARKAMLAAKASSRGNSIDGSSTRVMNVMNGSARAAPSRSDAAAPPASSSSSTPHQQRQQHLLHLQKQHQQHHHHHQQQQQQLQMQQLASRAAKASGAGNSAAYSDRMPGGAAMSKLPNALSGIPQALLQGNNGPVGSPQWKNTANPRASSAGALPSPPSQVPSNPPAAAKNNHQGRSAPSPQSQQISFGIRTSGGAAAGAPAAPPVASPTSSVAKTMSGSPRASPTTAKMAAPPGSASQPAHQPKGPVPGSHGRSNGKTSSPSILGQPHLATSPGAGMKQPQQQSQKQQAFPPPQIFFANSYLQQPPQQQPSPHSLTLGGGAAATTSDPPAKTAPPPNSGMKGIPFISAAGFPYFHGMSSVPVKPAEQKPAAGS